MEKESKKAKVKIKKEKAKMRSCLATIFKFRGPQGCGRLQFVRGDLSHQREPIFGLNCVGNKARSDKLLF